MPHLRSEGHNASTRSALTGSASIRTTVCMTALQHHRALAFVRAAATLSALVSFACNEDRSLPFGGEPQSSDASLPDLFRTASPLTCPALFIPGAGGAVAPSSPLFGPPGSFTMEIWFFDMGGELGQFTMSGLLLAHQIGSAGGGYIYRLTEEVSDGVASFGVSNQSTMDAGYAVDYSVPSAFNAHHWVHVAAVYDLSVPEMRIYINGEMRNMQGDVNLPNPAPVLGDLGPLILGGPSNESTVNAYLSEVRLSGSARYTSNFMPPAKLIDDGDTIALYHLDGARDEVAAIDSSAHANTAMLMGGAVFADPPVCR